MTSVQNWRQVYQAITKDIRAARFEPGCKLPSQAVLARRYGASRHSVRRALQALADEETISSWQGREAVLLSKPIVYEIGRKTRLASGLRTRGHCVQVSILNTRRAHRLSSQIAALLDMPVGSYVQFAELLHHVDGVPTALGKHYFNDRIAPDIRQDATGADPSVPEAFSRNGVADYFRAATYVEVRQPMPYEALALEIPPSQSVFCLLGQNMDPSGKPIEVTEAIVRSDTVKLHIEPYQVHDLV